MADKIGVARRWHQKSGTPHSHYDICKAKRAQAVALGAVEVDRAGLVSIIKRKRATTEEQLIDRHWCKHCETWFAVELGAKFSGDVFLVCPTCSSRHYRHFTNGVAIHCDITKTHDTPKPIKGRI